MDVENTQGLNDLYNAMDSAGFESETAVDNTFDIDMPNGLIADETASEQDSTAVASAESTNNAEPKSASRRTRKKTSTIEDEDDVTAMYERKVLRSLSSAESKKAIGTSDVVSRDGDYNVYTHKDAKREEWNRIADSIRNNKIILTGMIIGAESVGEGSNKIHLAKVHLDDSEGFYDIKIPASYLFDTTAQRYQGAEGNNAILRDLTFRIGSTIDFVIFDAKINRKEVYASRLHAMAKLGHEYYMRKDAKTGKPKISDGQIVKATITLVGKWGIVAECCGCEFFIKNSELEYMHIDDCRTNYFAGDTINVKISNIRQVPVSVNGKNIHLIMADASKKQAEPNPMELFWDDFKIGGTYKGVVKFRAESGFYYVTLDGKIDCLCLPPNQGIPQIGQNCIVTIHSKTISENNSKLVRGKFITLLR